MTSALSPSGVLLVDKPQGWTSHDVVARARRLLGTKKVGHAGTLDPMATGLLVLGVGKATRLLTYFVGADKTYETTIRLGASTPTDDADSEADVFAEPAALSVVSEEGIRAGIAALTGEIEQVPSSVSAIKVDGVRSYQRVRAGEEVRLKARAVTVRGFDVHDIRRVAAGEGTDYIDVDATIVCSSGTYIRALARDLGAGLGVGGHLTALRRTTVGNFDVGSATVLPGWDEPETGTPAAERLMSPAAAAGLCLPSRGATAEEKRELGFGRRIAPSIGAFATAPEVPGQPVAVIGPEGDLLAVVENVVDGGEIVAKPLVVFAP